MGLFAGLQQYKAALHTHTTNSDGDDPLHSVIEEHYSRGYDILAITDHDFVTRDWVSAPNGLSQQRFDEIAAGTDRGNRGMLQIPDTIEHWHHNDLNTYIANYRSQFGDTIEKTIDAVGNLGGLAMVNHPGRYNVTASGYATIFVNHSAAAGLEVVNRQDLYQSDRIMWDNVNTITIPQGRVVWGFSNDDSHSNAGIGFSFNVMIMPVLSVDAFRTATFDGRFYAVARVAHNEGVNNPDRDSATPVILDIDIDAGRSITVTAENYTLIQWVTSGTQTLATGGTLDMQGLPADVGPFVRATVIGPGGIAFSQPFAITPPRRPGIEYHVPLRVKTEPVEDDDVVTVKWVREHAPNGPNGGGNGGNGGGPMGPLAGDVVGESDRTVVVGLQTRSVASVQPLRGQALVWSGITWIPVTIPGIELPEGNTFWLDGDVTTIWDDGNTIWDA